MALGGNANSSNLHKAQLLSEVDNIEVIEFDLTKANSVSDAISSIINKEERIAVLQHSACRGCRVKIHNFLNTNKMSTKNLTTERKKAKAFAFSFQTSQSAENIFKTLIDVRSWWTGLYGETIKGDSSKLNDEFTFKAGNGAHFTKLKLLEAEPNKRIAWLVTESNLNFLKKADEWTNTKICFDISNQSNKTKVSFKHEGLVPDIECYNGCAGAWTQYLENLAKRLK